MKLYNLSLVSIYSAYVHLSYSVGYSNAIWHAVTVFIVALAPPPQMYKRGAY